MSDFVWFEKNQETGELVKHSRPFTDEERIAAEAHTAACRPTRAQVEAERRHLYQAESDPLYFAWKRGEGTEQDWLDKIEAIKAANPYPV